MKKKIFSLFKRKKRSDDLPDHIILFISRHVAGIIGFPTKKNSRKMLKLSYLFEQYCLIFSEHIRLELEKDSPTPLNPNNRPPFVFTSIYRTLDLFIYNFKDEDEDEIFGYLDTFSIALINHMMSNWKLLNNHSNTK